MLNKINKNQKGFTLIELMIVITVISILSAIVLGVLNSSGIQAKARDSERIAQIKKLQTALELYFADNRVYPGTAEQWLTPTELMGVIGGSYIDKVPGVNDANNPRSSADCDDADDKGFGYYAVDSGGGFVGDYVLFAVMEVETSKDDSPCADLDNWGTACLTIPSDIDDYCYGVSGP